MKSKIIFCLYLTALFLLFIYSFTQIDLNLTLSQIPIWQRIEKAFTYIGYFQRPFSTTIYLVILFLLFTSYFLLLQLVKKGRAPKKQIWLLIGLTAGILLFSYPAFSHDIFNYIFDAKIVAFYHQSPYKVKPLDFPDDPMTRFMHWTHRPSVYPPLWIGLSALPFVLGFGKFILQLLSFKAMMAGCYLGTTWLIYKISEVLTPKQKMVNVVFYAFNPLVLIESLVSGHNDGVMAFFSLLAFYLLLKGKVIFSILSWLFSVSIKYTTIFLFPAIFWSLSKFCRVKKVDYKNVFKIAVLTMYLAIFAFSYYLELQPWYFLWVLPFVALALENQLFFWLTICFSLGSLLRYTPFLYYGHWNLPVPTIKLWLTVLPVSLGFLVYLIKRYGPR